MNPGELKKRVAELLVEEVKNNPLEWYYVSMVHVPTHTFAGGFVIEARGTTEVFCLMHSLNFTEKDCETQTAGPIEKEVMEKIPKELRWRKLSKEESTNLGS